MRLKILFFPFILIWNFIEFIIKITGRLLAVILGFVLMIAGITLCVTVVGALIGVPLIVLGTVMIIRGFF